MADAVVKSANDLAAERTDLAVDRTVMAAGRTLMAWVRTALSMISFGFTIYKSCRRLCKRLRLA
jgi:putative membrane protein